MPRVPREDALSSRKHKRSIISRSDPSWGRLLHARILEVGEALGAPNPGLHGMADRAFETSAGHEPSYRRADLCFKQLTIYPFNAPDVLAT